MRPQDLWDRHADPPDGVTRQEEGGGAISQTGRTNTGVERGPNGNYLGTSDIGTLLIGNGKDGWTTFAVMRESADVKYQEVWDPQGLLVKGKKRLRNLIWGRKTSAAKSTKKIDDPIEPGGLG